MEKIITVIMVAIVLLGMFLFGQRIGHMEKQQEITKLMWECEE